MAEWRDKIATFHSKTEYRKHNQQKVIEKLTYYDCLQEEKPKNRDKNCRYENEASTDI